MKDIFNGKIRKQYIGYMKLTLILVSILFFTFFIFFLLFATLYENMEYSARIFMYCGSVACLIFSILYPLLSLYSIRTYPNHKKLAHALIKEFVFQTDEIRIDDIIMIKNGKISIKDLPRNKDKVLEKIINYIPSKEIRNYLFKIQNELTIMQLATLVENYYKGNMIAILEALRDLSDSDYEKQLLTIAMKDYRKYKHFDERTQKYYLENDPRSVKPLCVFTEYIELPKTLNGYDLGGYYDSGKLKFVVIDKIEKQEIENPDFNDLSYMAYDLNFDVLKDKEDLFKIHHHVNYCEIEKVDIKILNKELLKKYELLVEFLKKNN